MAEREAAKAEERERLKREKLQHFRESVKANITEVNAKKKIQELRQKEQESKKQEQLREELKVRKEERKHKYPNLYDIKAKKKEAVSASITQKTEVITKTIPAAVKVKTEKLITTKEKYSPVSTLSII
eukprot:TRINITY_DN14578_c0_g1_i3.p1 TRINITY_DN14578_c0_g1~~TRINITY_DN14578_c0_g1_i3.p1  ORF type:complete len:128 (-),score=54.78 TRINITY_DN14578_c0_g1_i3:313-696(-)